MSTPDPPARSSPRRSSGGALRRVSDRTPPGRPTAYEIAIGHETRTRAFFEKKAKELPEGPERELFRELAAEEEEHIALLESERAKLNR